MPLIENLSQLLSSATGQAREKDSCAPVGRLMSLIDETGEGKRFQQQLWHGQKLEALGRLAAGIAHDFGNLLTVILGYSDLLVDQLEPSDPRRELVGEIQKAGSQARRLTRQILGFAGPQALEPQVLDVGNVLGSTERMLRRLIGANILLSTLVLPRLWPVKMDRGQIQQIIVNMAVNARDAMPEGGTLNIELANVTLEHPDQGQAGDYVMLAFHDTGTGMSPATRERIFEPFFTTKAAGKGTGLGLSMVDDIVKQNHGHIDVQSELGSGSTFQIYLPRAEHAAPAQPSAADNSPLPRGNEVVLLVEDEEAVRNLARQVLQMCGYKVLEAMDGQQAIALAEQHPEPIHLLLSDVVMPHMGGCRLAEIIRTRHPGLRVLFLSGHSIDYIYEQGAQQTDFSFLQKPFTVSALANKVREVLTSTASKPE